MELPLWLCKGLYEKKRKVLSVELPKIYKEGWRTVFTADPNVVDLHKMGPYYYGLGSQMLHFDSPENPDIAKTLLQVRETGRKYSSYQHESISENNPQWTTINPVSQTLIRCNLLWFMFILNEVGHVCRLIIVCLTFRWGDKPAHFWWGQKPNSFFINLQFTTHTQQHILLTSTNSWHFLTFSVHERVIFNLTCKF